MIKSVSFLILIFFTAMSLNAQDLSKHQWKERLVLIIAKEKNEKFASAKRFEVPQIGLDFAFIVQLDLFTRS